MQNYKLYNYCENNKNRLVMITKSLHCIMYNEWKWINCRSKGDLHIVSSKKLKKPSGNMLVSLQVRCDYIGIAYNTSFLISYIELLY